MNPKVKKIERIKEITNELDVLHVKIKTLFNELEKIQTKTNDPVELKAKQYKKDLIREEILKKFKDSNLLYYHLKELIKEKRF